MQNYITQRQVEMAGEKSAPSPAVQSPAATANGVPSQEEAKAAEDELDTFKNLSTLEMMDHLSRDLTHWQQMITEPNEK